MFPLSGAPARVLCQLAGIPPQEGGSTGGRWTWALYDHFDAENLFRRYADATPWSLPKARNRARLCDTNEVNVLLGVKVIKAFDLDVVYFEWTELPAGQLVVGIPHPSGLNRKLNNEQTRTLMGATLRDAMAKARGDE
jgi:hypothetical protein